MSIWKKGCCPFCKHAAEILVHHEDELYAFNCTVCNLYFISFNLKKHIEDNPVDNGILNCISENIRSNPKDHPIITSWHLKSDDLPKLDSNITVKRFEDFARVPIIHANKSMELLKELGAKATLNGPFEMVRLDLKNLYKLKILDWNEGWSWIKTLVYNGYIEIPLIHIPPDKNTEPFSPFSFLRPEDEEYEPQNEHLDRIDFTLTPTGWNTLHEAQTSINSTRVFIAMQFEWEDDTLKNKFVEAVQNACTECGYDANIVNQNHNNQITDEIIANIKESRFVVADFTYNNRGAYYEAGLAKGLGIPVIHTVMDGHTKDQKDDSKRLHFDIQQINHIRWINPNDLKQKLVSRIKAVIDF